MLKSINTFLLFFIGKDINMPSNIRFLIILRPDFLGAGGDRSDR